MRANPLQWKYVLIGNHCSRNHDHAKKCYQDKFVDEDDDVDVDQDDDLSSLTYWVEECESNITWKPIIVDKFGHWKDLKGKDWAH